MSVTLQESLLAIPLVEAMLADPEVRLVARQVDKRWHYRGIVPVSVAGFNPFTRSIYYGATSALASWLPDRERSARAHNEGDALMREVLFAVHDYLHIWSGRALGALRPELGFGVAPITRHNIDTLTFCHLLTEAAATVGLDYWYLSTIDLAEVVPIGTTMEGLAVSYHERFLPEYRRFRPDLQVQEPGFFQALARFYCTGIFEGFDGDDVRRSPRLEQWLRHELTYGARQRSYTRQWLAFLAHDDLELDERELAAPVPITEPWQDALMAELGTLLWALAKDGRRADFGRDASGWHSSLRREPDFRFINLNTSSHLAAGASSRESRLFQAYQIVSRHDYASIDPALTSSISEAVRAADVTALEGLLAAATPLPPCAEEPRDLLLLN